MKKILKILLWLFLYFLLFSFFLFISLNLWIDFQSNPDFNKIDAIVVLTGGRGRIDLGKKFSKLHRNIFLIISGANSKLSKQFLKKKLNLKGEKVIIENISKNTIENALQVKKILNNLKIKNILLITSKSHMIRALIIFKVILPDYVKIFPYAVEERISLLKVIKENIKILYFFIKLTILKE